MLKRRDDLPAQYKVYDHVLFKLVKRYWKIVLPNENTRQPNYT